MSKHDKLWNDLPLEERERLMPYQVESQILHIRKCKEVAIRNHKRLMRELDDWIKNLERELPKDNVKAHIRATTDPQNNQTDGGALCDASCSASSFYDGETYASVMPYQEGMSAAEKENILRFQLDEAKRLMREEAVKNRNCDVV